MLYTTQPLANTSIRQLCSLPSHVISTGIKTITEEWDFLSIQNHGTVWVGRDLKDHLVPPPHVAQSPGQPGLSSEQKQHEVLKTQEKLHSKYFGEMNSSPALIARPIPAEVSVSANAALPLLPPAERGRRHRAWHGAGGGGRSAAAQPEGHSEGDPAVPKASVATANPRRRRFIRGRARASGESLNLGKGGSAPGNRNTDHFSPSPGASCSGRGEAVGSGARAAKRRREGGRPGTDHSPTRPSPYQRGGGLDVHVERPQGAASIAASP